MAQMPQLSRNPQKVKQESREQPLLVNRKPFVA
jgi:hypothetical protein